MIYGPKLTTLYDNVYDNKDYGELKFYYKTWELGSTPKYTELNTTDCTKDDLIPAEGADKTNYGFFRPEDELLVIVEEQGPRF